MNYSDFPDIRQDDWSLTRPTFPTPKGGTLTVVGWRMEHGKRVCIVECDKCKEDTDIFGDGLFKIRKGGRGIRGTLIGGAVPCGCATKSPRFDEKQFTILAKREADRQGVEFLGFVAPVGSKIVGRTRVVLSCKTHGEWSTTRVGSFLHERSSCPSCHMDHVAEMRRTKEVPPDLKGKLPDHYKLAVSSRRGVNGRCIIRVECPVCATDNYSAAGAGDGVFYSTVHNLRQGKLPCRCSNVYKYTLEQNTKRATDACTLLGYTFIGWETKHGGHQKVRYSCPSHGEHATRLSKLSIGSGCPICAGKNQKQCYINLVYDNQSPVAVKFGIAKDSDKRIRGQNYTNLFQMEQSAVYEFKTVKACKDAERACKRELKCSVLSERELKDGHTETVSLLDLEKVITIYERFGGVKVLTPEQA